MTTNGEPLLSSAPAAAARRISIGVGMPALLHLEAYGARIHQAYGHTPYLVGSAVRGKRWRDIDVRLILPDREFHQHFPEHGLPARHDPLWSLICAALSELGRIMTQLPIDFQIQSETSNIRPDRIGRPRVPLGIYAAQAVPRGE
jgi:hypothetical protein